MFSNQHAHGIKSSDVQPRMYMYTADTDKHPEIALTWRCRHEKQVQPKLTHAYCPLPAAVSHTVSVQYKQTPRGSADPMQAPGPIPCPTLLSQGATKAAEPSQVSPTTWGIIIIMSSLHWDPGAVSQSRRTRRDDHHLPPSRWQGYGLEPIIRG